MVYNDMSFTSTNFGFDLSNREIAEELTLQEKTVKHYMTSILSKLHARNRVEAALIAHDAWKT